jgi:hypothetical protein
MLHRDHLRTKHRQPSWVTAFVNSREYVSGSPRAARASLDCSPSSDRRMAVLSRTIFFIGRCRSTRTPCLKTLAATTDDQFPINCFVSLSPALMHHCGNGFNPGIVNRPKSLPPQVPVYGRDFFAHRLNCRRWSTDDNRAFCDLSTLNREMFTSPAAILHR